MINKITLRVASYKKETYFEPNKKLNIIYGLNGTGKSTISEFLRNYASQTDEKFKNCSIYPNLNTDEQILVYNQKWVNDIFYTNPTLKGIFTLSKENNEAKKAIDEATSIKNKLIEQIQNKDKLIQEKIDELKSKRNNALNTVWKIKTQYSGGDRKTEFCLKGLMGNKETMFDYLSKIPKPVNTPNKNIKEIDKELVSLLDDNVTKFSELQNLYITDLTDVEKEFLTKEIIGSSNSSFSSLIESLKNSDWVNQGLQYLNNQDVSTLCPFCQQKIDKNHILAELKSCFDKTYEEDTENLKKLSIKYENQINKIAESQEFEDLYLIKDFSASYKASLTKLKTILDKNESLIKQKINEPSKSIILKDYTSELNNINDIINQANEKVKEFNEKIDRKDETLSKLKELFWQNLRLEYDTVLSNFETEKKQNEKSQKQLEDEKRILQKQINEQDDIINKQSKNVANIDEAIKNINAGLLDLGIDSFKIEKYSSEDDLYKLSRAEQAEENIFESLSEGEKMIISFLYFIEECKGKQNAKDSEKKRIIVIDDPISSLSHIYVFNIAELIKNVFLNKNLDNWEQVFILTHSLYFFYELIGQKKFSSNDLSPDEQARLPKLFRIMKSSDGSHLVEMKANEIQNDYQMYWSVVNNKDNQPALIANCMRNIIDYFFGFIEKKALNEVFQKPEFKDNIRYKGFYRYINRESHSDNTNIYDMKEFDYESFHEAFQNVFILAGYKEHYRKMSKIGKY